MPSSYRLVILFGMDNTKPYVTAAFICEKILQEKDDVLSAIRIVDRMTVTMPENIPSGITPVVELTLLASLKSGAIKGKSKVSLAIRRPSGEREEKGPWPVLFNGGEHGIQLNLTFPLEVREFGLYWFDILWNGEHMTSAPLKLIRAEEPRGGKVPKARKQSKERKRRKR